MRLKGILFVFSFLILHTLIAQLTESHELKWGEFMAGDLTMTHYPLDSAASAVVLGDEGIMHIILEDGYPLIRFNVHQQIKILGESAIDEYGNVEIYFYHEGGIEKINGLKAQTTNPDGSVFQLKRKEFFTEKISDSWSKITFAFSNVQVGSILEFQYRKLRENFVTLPEWSFRQEIPVRMSTFTFINEAPLVYAYIFEGREYMEGTPLENGRTIYTLDDMKLVIDKTKFAMLNGQAVKEEAYMTTVEDYVIKVQFQAREIMYPDGTSKTLYSTWEEVAEELLDNNNFGWHLEKQKRYEDLLAASEGQIDRTATAEEKIYQICQFVGRELKWNGNRGIYTEIDLNEAFKRHEAGLAEVQLSGIALLREYGVWADPLILSTRNNGAMIVEYPMLRQFDYVAVTALVEGQPILLDFSDPLLRPGMLRLSALNHKGFIVKKNDPEWVNIEMPPFSELHAYACTIDPEGMIGGKMRNVIRGFPAFFLRHELDDDSLEETWKDKMPEETTLSNLEVTNQSDVREPLKIEGNFVIPDAAVFSGDFIYITPVFYAGFEENPFETEKRSYPVDIPYSFENRYVYSYDIPAGYVVEELPESAIFALPDGGGSFTFNAVETNEKIQITSLLIINQTFFKPEYYVGLRSFFDIYVEKNNEQIVLKKME